MHRLSAAQAVIACVVLIAATIAAGLHDISGSNLTELYLAVAGYALGYVNGNKTTLNQVAARLTAVENKQ